MSDVVRECNDKSEEVFEVVVMVEVVLVVFGCGWLGVVMSGSIGFRGV